MKNIRKKQEGITLIALVVTIIVLLILAGVTISMLTGDNGIITKTTDAKTTNEQALDYEKVRLAAQAAYSKGYPVNGKLDKATLVSELQTSGIISSEGQLTETETNGVVTYSVTKDGTTYTISEKGTVTKADASSSGSGQATAKQWSLPEGDTTVNVGDLLTPTVTGLENEKFYVIADDGTKLTLLAEKCIKITSTSKTQDDEYTTVAFDSSPNVYANSSIRGLVKDYVDTLTGLDLLDVEEVSGGLEVSGRKGRLMWYEETQDTTFKAATNYSDILYGPSTSRINYWLGSPNGRRDLRVACGWHHRGLGLRLRQRRLLWASSSYKNLKI